jgi:Phage integrase, N-terminal SAM-like domain
MKPGRVPLKSIRLLDRARERSRYLYCSLNTEQSYQYWVNFFVRAHGRDGAMRHPRDMGAHEAESFLTMLANKRKVSASAHNQAPRRRTMSSEP